MARTFPAPGHPGNDLDHVAKAIASCLTRSRTFGDLPPAWLIRLAALSTRRRFVEGERLWWMGDTADQFVLIDSGAVRIVAAREQGDLTSMGIFGPRDSIGDTAVYERTTYPADAIAISKVVDVVRVPAAEILAALPSDAAIGFAAHRTLLLHHRVLRAKLEVLTAGSVAARTATLLCHLSDRFGETTGPHRSRVTMDLSRTIVASFVQARVETVIRTLSRWRSEGLVKFHSDGFEIDTKTLREVASGR